ncbi:MAG: hypothetical protein ABSA40_09195 [Candidatus Dormibacteria bacterium]|jgi:ketosteroid isomerase-like protein
MNEPGDNLATLLSAWTAMLRTGRTAELAGILAADVVWQGLRPELRCANRDQVLGVLVRNRGRPPRITRIEAQERGAQVAVSVEGADLPEAPVELATAARSLVFTFRDGRVVRMESLPDRDAAFARLLE